MLTLLRPLVLITAFLSLGLTLLGQFFYSTWPFALFQHFLPYCLVIQGLGFVASFWEKTLVKRRTFVGLFLVVILWQCSLLSSLQLLPSKQSTKGLRPQVKLLLLNVYQHTVAREERLLKAIQATEPDLLAFTEVTPKWDTVLDQKLSAQDYPYRTDGKAHLKLISKFPLQETRLEYTNSAVANHATLITDWVTPRAPITLLLSHPPLPSSQENLTQQAKQVAQWETSLRGLSTYILLGDFNGTPWAYPYADLIKTHQLQDSMTVSGLQGTWPTYAPFLALPIDHVWTSPNIQILDRKRLESTGSDHYPLLVYLEL